MDAKTLEALQASIEKWERNAVAETPGEYLTKGRDCPLCQIFVTNINHCGGCPVFERTGAVECEDTPYLAADTSKWEWLATPSSAERRDIARECARAEAAFLKSLLPTA